MSASCLVRLVNQVVISLVGSLQICCFSTEGLVGYSREPTSIFPKVSYNNNDNNNNNNDDDTNNDDNNKAAMSFPTIHISVVVFP